MPELLLPPGVAKVRRDIMAAQQAPRRRGLGAGKHLVNPAKVLMDMLGITEPGKITDDTGKEMRLHGNRILIAVYVRPEELASGIKLPDQTRKEDEYQGKAGLVVMKGHSAFVSDEHFTFGPDRVEVGDWVSLHVTDGRSIIIKGVLCRIVRDQDIVAVIPNPDFVY